ERPSLSAFQRALEHRSEGHKPWLGIAIAAILLLILLTLAVSFFVPEDELRWEKFPESQQWTQGETVDIHGQSSRSDAALTIDEKSVKIEFDGSFNYSYLLKDGENRVRLELTKGDQKLVDTLTIVRDKQAPKLIDRATKIGNYSVLPGPEWHASVEDLCLDQFEVNGFVQASREGQFRVAFSAAPKVYMMKWRAKDKVGLSSSGGALVLTQESVDFAFEGLKDRTAWNRLDPSLQDFVAMSVSLDLGSAFELKGCETFQCGALKHRLAVYHHKKTGARFHLIPGGRFILGTPDLKRELDFCRRTKVNYPTEWIYRERAQREVLVLPVLVSQTEVTVRQWYSIIDEDMPKRADWPVAGKSFLKVKQWLKQVGQGLRLPSEAEWEYFSRAGSRTRFFWGPELNKDYAWTRESTKDAHSVFEHKEKTNAFGLLDTLGNLHEWCEDHWHNDYSGGPKDHKPRQRPDSTLRVFRGGSYNRYAAKNRVTYRNGMSETETKQAFDVGFRVVVSLPARKK
ncbi:MAG: SUMF1/EgtB/PvdO family nonheme iron enzyme, partial [Planctomycetota bacterium]|nr:SUMF1/EgtB/PvdO family nonheme iron enzyme [Planctomycetota bacterium]